MNWLDLAGTLVGFLLTVSIFSYFLGDNWLFRLAVHLFVGVSAGLVVVVVWYHLLWPKLIQPFISGEVNKQLFMLVVILSSMLLLMKIIPRLSFLSSPVVAVLVGVGAAVAIGGSLIGTIFVLVGSLVNSFDFVRTGVINGDSILKLMNAVILLVGTISTLLYFQSYFRSRSHPKNLLETTASIGKIFLILTFGALFALVLSAALAALLERLDFFIGLANQLLNGGG